MPTMIVRGSKSDSIADAGMERLHAIPGSQKNVLDDAGHACYIDNPTQWHQALKEFLSSLGSKS